MRSPLPLLTIGLLSLSFIAAFPNINVPPARDVPILKVSRNEALRLRKAERMRVRKEDSGQTKNRAAANDTTVATALACPASVTFKAMKGFGPAFGEVPSTWSYYFAGESMPEPLSNNSLAGRPFFSIAQNGVAFGDMNWNQIDFHKAAGSDVARLIRTMKANNEPGEWSKETVGGVQADVFTGALDNGQITKGGSGGKMYFFSWQRRSDSNAARITRTYDVGLVIDKQALGDAEFECGFQHLLSNISFDDYLQRFTTEFPVMQ